MELDTTRVGEGEEDGTTFCQRVITLKGQTTEWRLVVLWELILFPRRSSGCKYKYFILTNANKNKLIIVGML